MKAGDQVWVRSGTYREIVNIQNSGELNKIISFKGYGPNPPTIDRSISIEGWTEYSDQIYSASVAVPVNPVIVDGIILDQVQDLGEMKEGSFYQTGDQLYVWCPNGNSPLSHEVGVVKQFRDWNEPSAVTIAADHILLSGFVVKYSSGAGIKCTGNFVRMENCVVGFSVYHGIVVEKGWDCAVVACEVYQNSLMNWPRGSLSSGWAAGIGFVSGGRGLAVGNRVYSNHGEGIGTLGGWGSPGTAGLKIKQNTVFDNWSANIWIDHCSNVLIDGNFIFLSGGEPNPSLSKSTPAGILCAEEDGFGNPGDLHDGVITNNIVIGCQDGLGFWRDGIGSGLRNFVIANNTFANSVNYGIEVDYGDHAGSLFENNIIYQGGKGVLRFNSPSDTVFKNNCWYRPVTLDAFQWDGADYDFDEWRSVSGQGKGSFWKIPGFAGGGALDIRSYRIKTSSPCRNTGIPLLQVTDDFWGTARPQESAYDVGAHEFSPKSFVWLPFLLGD